MLSNINIFIVKISGSVPSPTPQNYLSSTLFFLLIYTSIFLNSILLLHFLLFLFHECNIFSLMILIIPFEISSSAHSVVSCFLQVFLFCFGVFHVRGLVILE